MSRMIPKLYKEAKRLASQLYDVDVYEDELSDGTPCYLAKNPELPGCMAQGNTVTLAIEALTSARADYIYFRLFDGLQVNPPRYNPTAVNPRVTIHYIDGKSVFMQAFNASIIQEE